MADSTQLPAQDIRGVVQSKFETEILAQASDDMPFLGWMLEKYFTKTRGQKGIRIASDGVMTGAPISRVQRKAIASHTWEPQWYQGLPSDDTKTMAWYDTMPEDTSAGAAGPLSRVKHFRFRRTDKITPITVWGRDLDELKNAFTSAKAAGDRAKADMIAKDITDLAAVAATEKMILQLKSWNSGLFATSSDYPTNADLLLWDKQYSLRYSCGVSGLYAGVDRDLTANINARGNLVTANVPADLTYLFNYMQYRTASGGGLGLKKKGVKPNLYLAGDVLFPAFKEAAKEKNYRVLTGDEIPNMSVFGQKQEAIRLNADTYVIHEPSLAAKGVDGATKNSMVCLSTDEIVMSVFGTRFFEAGKFDEQKARAGEAESITSNIRTQMGIWLPTPWSHVWFDDVG